MPLKTLPASARTTAADMLRRYRRTGELSATQRLTQLNARLTEATHFARGDVLVRNPVAKEVLKDYSRFGIGKQVVEAVKKDPNRPFPRIDRGSIADLILSRRREKAALALPGTRRPFAA